MALRTRPPTGLPPWPVILVEGGEKAGKTVTALQLAASEHVQATHVFEIGERAADGYAALGDFQLVDLDGTWSDFDDQYAEAATMLPVDGRPVVNVVDSGTVLWEGLKDWIGDRAARSKANRKLLAEDPDAAITVGNNLWNDANSRWGRFMRLTKAHQGITVITARSKTVAKIGANGAPIVGQTDYKIEAQKDLPNHVSAIVRVDGPRQVRLMGWWKLDAPVPPEGIPLDPDRALEQLVFDMLGAGGFAGTAGQDPQYGRTVVEAKRELVEVFTAAGFEQQAAVDHAAEVWGHGSMAGAQRGDEVPDAVWAEIEVAAKAALAPESAEAEG